MFNPILPNRLMGSSVSKFRPPTGLLQSANTRIARVPSPIAMRTWEGNPLPNSAKFVLSLHGKPEDASLNGYARTRERHLNLHQTCLTYACCMRVRCVVAWLAGFRLIPAQITIVRNPHDLAGSGSDRCQSRFTLPRQLRSRLRLWKFMTAEFNRSFRPCQAEWPIAPTGYAITLSPGAAEFYPIRQM